MEKINRSRLRHRFLVLLLAFLTLGVLVNLISGPIVRPAYAQSTQSDLKDCSIPSSPGLILNSIFVMEATVEPPHPAIMNEFLAKKVTVNRYYGDEIVCLSSTPDGKGALTVDDKLSMTVSPTAFGSGMWQHSFFSFSGNQGKIVPIPAQDVTRYFKSGTSEVDFRWIDSFMPNASTSPIYIVVWGRATPTAKPTAAQPTQTPVIQTVIQTQVVQKTIVLTPTPMPATPPPPPPDVRLTVSGPAKRELDMGTVKVDMFGNITSEQRVRTINLQWSAFARQRGTGTNVQLVMPKDLEGKNPTDVSIPVQWYLQPVNSREKKPNLYISSAQESFNVGLDLTQPFQVPPALWGEWEYRSRIIFNPGAELVVDGEVTNPPDPRFEAKFVVSKDPSVFIWLGLALLLALLVYFVTLPRFPYGAVLYIDNKSTGDMEALATRTLRQKLNGEYTMGGPSDVVKWGTGGNIASSPIALRPSLSSFILYRWFHLARQPNAKIRVETPATARLRGQVIAQDTWHDLPSGQDVTITAAGTAHTIKLVQPND